MQRFQDILGALYLAVLFLGIINAMSVQSIVFFERTVRPPAAAVASVSSSKQHQRQHARSRSVCLPCSTEGQ